MVSATKMPTTPLTTMVEHDDGVPELDRPADVRLERDRDHRAFETREVDRGDRHENRCDRGPVCSEQRVREEVRCEAGPCGVAGEHRIDSAVAEGGEHHPDDRVDRAYGERDEGAQDQPEHGTGHRPPGAGQGEPPHAPRQRRDVQGVVLGRGLGDDGGIVGGREVEWWY
jgi:hypothetical protein